MAKKAPLPKWLREALAEGCIGPYRIEAAAIGQCPAFGPVDEGLLLRRNVAAGELAADFCFVRFGPLEITVRGQEVPMRQFIALASKMRRGGNT